jgi:hypothetical protein
MLLSKYISDLQAFLKKNGDMECVYARDDEGNGYQKVEWSGSLYYTNELNEYHIDFMYSPQDFQSEVVSEGYDIEEFVQVCVVN